MLLKNNLDIVGLIFISIDYQIDIFMSIIKSDQNKL